MMNTWVFLTIAILYGIGCTEGIPDTCIMKPKTGPCRGYFPRFYFDSQKGKCTKFIYGGCQGNKNNFEKEKDCELMCSPYAFCSLKADPGLCLAYFPRYYYNSSEGKCKTFIYGGCGGNKNNFETLEECERACKG